MIDVACVVLVIVCGTGISLEENVAAMFDDFEITSIFRGSLPDGELFGKVVGIFVPDFLKKPGKTIDHGFTAEANSLAFRGKSDYSSIRFSVVADEFNGFMGGEDVGVTYFCDFVKSVVEIILCHAILLVVQVLKIILLYQFLALLISYRTDTQATFPG